MDGRRKDSVWSRRSKKKTSDSAILSGKPKSSNSKDLQKVKLKDIDLHDKDGDIKAEVARLAVNVALDLVMLNPIGGAQDIYRIGTVVSAHAKEKSAEKRKAKATIDEKTGLPLKAKEMTAEQDVKMVNPGYKNFNTNTKNNCVLCSTAMELRRRGYDVTAGKAGVGYSSEEYTKFFKGAKFEAYRSSTGKQWKSGDTLNFVRMGKELTDWAEPKLIAQGEGARGYLSVQWGVGGGHSMAYEVKNGKATVYDAQCGKKKSLRSVANASIDIGFTRLDDKEPNWAEIKKAGAIA